MLDLTWILARLFVEVPRPVYGEETPRSSSQAVTCYYLCNHSKLEAHRTVSSPRTQQAADLHSGSTTLAWKHVWTNCYNFWVKLLG